MLKSLLLVAAVGLAAAVLATLLVGFAAGAVAGVWAGESVLTALGWRADARERAMTELDAPADLPGEDY